MGIDLHEARMKIASLTMMNDYFDWIVVGGAVAVAVGNWKLLSRILIVRGW